MLGLVDKFRPRSPSRACLPSPRSFLHRAPLRCSRALARGRPSPQRRCRFEGRSTPSSHPWSEALGTHRFELGSHHEPRCVPTIGAPTAAAIDSARSSRSASALWPTVPQPRNARRTGFLHRRSPGRQHRSWSHERQSSVSVAPWPGPVAKRGGQRMRRHALLCRFVLAWKAAYAPTTVSNDEKKRDSARRIIWGWSESE